MHRRFDSQDNLIQNLMYHGFLNVQPPQVTYVLHSSFFYFLFYFINNIYYNICSKSLKGSSRELTLFTFENTN